MTLVPLRNNFFTQEEWDEIILLFQPGDYIIQRKPGKLAVGRLDGRPIRRERLITEVNTNPNKKKRKRGRR